MNGFLKFLIGLLIAIIVIAVVVCLVAFIMSKIHDQSFVGEFQSWWTDWICPLFERMHWVKESTSNIRL